MLGRGGHNTLQSCHAGGLIGPPGVNDVTNKATLRTVLGRAGLRSRPDVAELVQLPNAIGHAQCPPASPAVESLSNHHRRIIDADEN